MDMVKKESLTNDLKNILIAPETAVTLPAIIGGTAGTTIKAGTPLNGDLADRDTAFRKETTSGTSNANAVLLHDVVLGADEIEANGTIILTGTVDLLKLDSTVSAMITSQVKTALDGKIYFVKGAK